MEPRGIYERIGGAPGCRRLAVALYSHIDRDPLLRPLFPGKTHTCAIEEFTAFLVQFLGGSPDHTQRRWWLSLPESHLRFQIGARERTAWLEKMNAAIEEVSLDSGVRAALHDFFEHTSASLVNHGAAPPSSGDVRDDELAGRWRVQRAIDETIAAIRSRESDRAIYLASALAVDDSVRCGL